MVDRETLLKFLASPPYRPMRRSDLARQFRLNEQERIAFRRLLAQLVKEGAIVRIKSNRFALPVDVDLVVGTLQANEKGFGFVTPEKEGEPDIYISPGNMHTALDGDTVVVRLFESRRHGRRREKAESSEGKIIRVQERKTEEIVGTLARTQQFLYVIPDNPRITRDIYVDQKHTLGAKPGDKVVAQLTRWDSVHVNPEGKLIELLGAADDPGVEIAAIIRKFKLPHQFPRGVEPELARLPEEVEEKDLEGRRDFRKEIVVTIDPDDAKDFDDAISLERLPHGRWRLGVHIADVSHYIPFGSALDQEAYQRGTSVYFPGRVVPMLPEKLSNHLCSLKQGVNRLVKSVVAELSADGSILKQEFYNGVIRSNKRYTYREVKKIVSGEDAHLARANAETVPTLELMKELALLLQRRRLERGSLDLDIPGVKIWVDIKGKVTAIEKEERDIAHTMIEEFMLIANELVARHLGNRGLPCIYRVHDKPDTQNLDDFIALVKSFGFNIPPVTKTKKIQEFLDSIKGHPDSYTINYNLLRTLKQAVYATKNIGHYALALSHYTHFTSPIRRYPDLMVHRLLGQTLDSHPHSHRSTMNLARERMASIAKHCSETERNAAEAEYEAVDLKKLEYLQEQIAKGKHLKMEGVVRSILNFGFFVQTNDLLIDGLVHASTLTDDFYRPDSRKIRFVGKKTGSFFKLGDVLTVEPVKIDLVKRQVDFRVISKQKVSAKLSR